MTDIPLVDPADHKRCVQRAIEYRVVLIGHLAASLRSGGRVLPHAFPAALNPMTDEERDTQMRAVTEAALMFLPTAELVLWRGDLLRHAHSQADQFADAVVMDGDLPSGGELWFPYGQVSDLPTIGGNERNTYSLLFQLLLPHPSSERPSGKAGCLLRIAFCFPMRDGIVRVAEPPRLTSEQLLTVGERPDGFDARAFLSSLSFRASKFVTDDRIEPALSRAERRRMERAGTPSPVVRIVNLRHKERSDAEIANLTDRADAHYNCQWFVRPHVRRPNPRMKEQRPIWVPGYIKGPEGKPLKSPTLTINVVKR